MKRGLCVPSAVVIVVTAGAIGVPGPTSLRAQAQTPERLPRFEVASIKENKSGDTRVRFQTQPGGRFVVTNALLKGLIAQAFSNPQPLQLSRILGGPEWIGATRYDITAKASAEFQLSPDGPPRELLLMIRALLEERFALKTHREARELPIYELVVARADGKLGPELHQSTVDCDAVAASLRSGTPPPPRQPMEPPPCDAMRGPARIIAGGIPMEQFATMLTTMLSVGPGPVGDQGRLVVNKTGLTGRFAFTVTWTPEQMPAGTPPPGVPPVDPNGPSFFTALQEQLGLKLVSAKGPVEVLVIDSVERPTVD